MNTCLNAVTKYVNGVHCIIFKITGCPVNIDKFHITGVNQKNSCINIPNKFEKSGTTVVIADVNLVNAIIKQNVAIKTYISNNILGVYLYIRHNITAIAIKNNPTKLDATIEIAGIVSTGNTTFFTR